MKKLFIILLICSPLSVIAYEKPVQMDMEGMVKIWGKQSPNSEIPGLSLFITGKAAEKLYKDMKVEAVHNECFNDGTLTKYLGSFECSYSEKHLYSCTVGIGLAEQKLFYGEAC